MLQKLKNLFQESFVYSAGSIVIKLGGFLMMPLYIKYTTNDEFGLIMLLEVIFQFIQAIAGWGLKGGFQRYYYGDNSKKEQDSLFYTSFIYNVFTTLLAAVLVYLMMIFFTKTIFNYEVSGKVILLFSLASFSRLIFDIPFILLKLQQKSVQQTLYQTLNIGLTLTVTYITLETLNLGFEGVYWGQFIANGLTIIALMPLVIKNSHPKFMKSSLMDMIRFGSPLILSNVLSVVFLLSDRFMIGNYNTLSDLGSYSIAVKISSLLQLIIFAPFFTSYTFDYYRHINEKTTDRFYLKSFTYFIYIMAAAAIILTLFSKEVIFLLSVGEDSFYEAIPLIPLMVLGLIFSGMRQVFSLPLNKVMKTRLITLVLIVTGAFNFGINLLVIPVWGKTAAALTSLTTQLIGAIWFYFLIKKYETNTFEIGKISKALLISFVLIYSYIYLSPQNIILDITAKFIALPLFFLLLYLFKCFEPIEIERMKQAWSKWKKLGNIKSNIRSFKKL
jgi:O-antigen/teichoic acid export membrane protein